MDAKEFIRTFATAYYEEQFVIVADIYLSCVLLNGMSVDDYIKNARIAGDRVELILPMRTEKVSVIVTERVNTKYIGIENINPLKIHSLLQRIVPPEYRSPRKVWKEVANSVCEDEELVNVACGHKIVRKYSQEEIDALTKRVAELVFPYRYNKEIS